MKTCYCAGDQFSVDRTCPDCSDKLVAARDFNLDRFTRAMDLADHMARTTGLMAGKLMSLQKSSVVKPGSNGKAVDLGNLDPHKLAPVLGPVGEVLKRGGVARSMLLALTLDDWRKRKGGAAPAPGGEEKTGFKLVEGGENAPEA